MFLLAFIFEFVFIFTVYLIEEKRTQKHDLVKLELLRNWIKNLWFYIMLVQSN